MLQVQEAGVVVQFGCSMNYLGHVQQLWTVCANIVVVCHLYAVLHILHGVCKCTPTSDTFPAQWMRCWHCNSWLVAPSESIHRRSQQLEDLYTARLGRA
jgi:hypothetical protein